MPLKVQLFFSNCISRWESFEFLRVCPSQRSSVCYIFGEIRSFWIRNLLAHLSNLWMGELRSLFFARIWDCTGWNLPTGMLHFAVDLPKSATDPVNKKHLNHQVPIHYGRGILRLALSITPSQPNSTIWSDHIWFFSDDGIPILEASLKFEPNYLKSDSILETCILFESWRM